MQVELAPDKRLLGKHDIAFTTVGATKPTLNVLELAL